MELHALCWLITPRGERCPLAVASGLAGTLDRPVGCGKPWKCAELKENQVRQRTVLCERVAPHQTDN